jgi:hypothetical protein
VDASVGYRTDEGIRHEKWLLSAAMIAMVELPSNLGYVIPKG